MYDKLKQHADEKYKIFNSKLIPNIDEGKIIGVRMPILRKITKEIDYEEGQNFLNYLPHFYHEENLIHAFLINEIKDEKIVVDRILEFSKHIDNWAVTDAINPKSLKKHPEMIRELSKKLLKKSGEFEIRLGIILMMRFLQGENFIESDLDLILKKSDFYYVNMARAWYVADLVYKNEIIAIEFIKTQKMDAWTQNKSIQKICESFRVDDDLKEKIKMYRINEKL